MFDERGLDLGVAPTGTHRSDRERLNPPLDVERQRLAAENAGWLERSRVSWDARAERWDARAEANALAPDRAVELNRISEALRLQPGSRVLDAGCGSGQLAIALAERGMTVTGVDLSPAMIRRANAHATS